MKAAVLHHPGSTPRYEEFSEPVITNSNQELIQVRSSSIKNIDKMMALGSHYAMHGHFPLIVGVDGVGILADGRRVYAASLPPFGMMAEKALIQKGFFVPVPDLLDDIRAAAIPNPGVSAWLSLSWRAKIKKGDKVFVLGATGVTGKLAIQFARQMGAGRIIAAGRNEQTLKSLEKLGADQLLCLRRTEEEIKKDFKETIRSCRPDIILDYLWGMPAECLLDALTGHDLRAFAQTTRYIQIGEMAGPRIHLAAAVLRSAGIEICGQGGGSIPQELMAKLSTEIIPGILNMAAEGKITIDTETIPLSQVESAWNRKESNGKRGVIVPDNG
jgi:NADPH:quinone reductase-like Zn-dependent oxidoreductase